MFLNKYKLQFEKKNKFDAFVYEPTFEFIIWLFEAIQDPDNPV